MNRGGDGEMNSAMETVSAAATAIASAESRVPPSSVQKRRWSGCLSTYWCFGSQKNSKKFGHAVLVPEPTPQGNGVAASTSEHSTQPSAIRMPFVAPPSSPASFLPSEPQSALHSPATSVGLNSHSPNLYSPPSGPRSIFAIGPYAHETQLVTPPVFSTYTTEPSTAPFTPPPESVHLTTPSSPEVPFAQLLDPIHRYGDACHRFPPSHYDFQSYLLHPGSPVGPLISPGSAVSGSGTSSPFPDPYFPDIRYGVPQKLLTLEVGPMREWSSQQASGSVTPDAVQPQSRDNILLDRQDSVLSSLPNIPNGHRNNDYLIDHRVSFELTSEDVVRCVEKKPTALPKALQHADDRNYNTNNSVDDCTSAGTSEKGQTNFEEGQRHHKQRAASLGSIKEFNFDHVNGLDSDKPCINSNWWANEKVIGKEEAPCQNWSFFPVMQSGVS
ncbi:protein transport protein SEC31-like [Chenopodium quinoa]|uniref:Hydroxyproline-rich glycoprotein family protein n=1 Tax=Chenopodium quinoa TaxID=63459 RepID=A0A803LQF5_CHEQI|nr:protein transport protein SEC31-like [Chenopodium quinoa]